MTKRYGSQQNTAKERVIRVISRNNCSHPSKNPQIPGTDGQVETPLRRIFRSIKSSLQHASANVRQGPERWVFRWVQVRSLRVKIFFSEGPRSVWFTKFAMCLIYLHDDYYYWVVVSDIFYVHPETWGRFPFWLIFFNGVETTNYYIIIIIIMMYIYMW